jgi:hypothetical protein
VFSLCLKDINLNTTIKYHDILWASKVKSGIWHMFCISKTRADRGKLVVFLESTGQIYPETGLTFEASKFLLANVIIITIIIVIIRFRPTCRQNKHKLLDKR